MGLGTMTFGSTIDGWVSSLYMIIVAWIRRQRPARVPRNDSYRYIGEGPIKWLGTAASHGVQLEEQRNLRPTDYASWNRP
jgi:hypothetical protein